ncbi:hypothetical protein PTSG_09763 [Salpingoeca rosetta]|uniref:Sulfatase N-terminal domain-containing protein n=1 Tax=Salpingoeca rosetta (strain ATCC 50818 / BSB-021) TaxID=946362 RepID=F2UNZ4_SALR5|nr:uncharacterized protein PTSG_09763 [Salpingoeca rosetta]EGD79349.1 hypothetical protein PTSG_09763 [Salpingoeca rosetta]|eukprot:XP_004989118.1 hypothetical protein PTSG_09763 [Salpingoeca rosetta]
MPVSRSVVVTALVTTVLALLLAAAPRSCAAASSERPNVLILFLDDVGADRFPFYGSNIDVSPNLNELYERAVTLDAFFTQPICGPSRACLLSGRLTSNTKAYSNGHKRNKDFDESECTLGSVFQQAGYRTGLFGKLHASHPYVKTLDTSCGFDTWAVWARRGPRYHNSTIETNIGEGNLTFDGLVDAVLDPESASVPRRVALTNTYHPHLNRELAKAFISTSVAEDQNFLLHMPMILTHGPYEDKPQDPSLPADMEAEEDNDALFNQRLMVADAVVGDILRHMEVEGVANNTIVVAMGDNGTPRKYSSIVNGVETRSGKRHAGETKGTRVPFLLFDPRLGTTPRTVKPITSMVDVLPTLMDATGVNQLPAGKDPLDGTSFWPLVTGESKRRRQWSFLFSKTRAPHAVVRNRKIIITSDGTVYRERKWYDPVQITPEVVCRKRKYFRRFKSMVKEAWKLDIDVTFPGSDTAYPPNSCSKIVCNDETSLPECVPACPCK